MSDYITVKSPITSQLPPKLPEVECEDCGWQGDEEELINKHCPECNSPNIVDYDWDPYEDEEDY